MIPTSSHSIVAIKPRSIDFLSKLGFFFIMYSIQSYLLSIQVTSRIG